MATGRGQYTSGFPLQEVRTRNWPAGKTAVLKRAVSLLENQLNQSMAAQVDQGGKRVFNSRVPKVTGLTIKSGFKNFALTFNDARGIDDLLFYEIQKDSTPSFSAPTTYTIPQTTLTIPTTVEHEKVYFRVRVLNSSFECGPWSATASGTGSSNFRINITRQDRVVQSIAWSNGANLDTWFDICSVTYTPSAASVCLNIHAGVYLQCSTETNRNNDTFANADSWNFRILRNGVELTNAGQMIGLCPEASYSFSTGAGVEHRIEEATFQSFVTPFETFTGQEDPVTYTLQAKNDSSLTVSTILPKRTFKGGNTNASQDPSIIIVDCFDLMEIVQSF
jgi:hypothetical protein